MLLVYMLCLSGVAGSQNLKVRTAKNSAGRVKNERFVFYQQNRCVVWFSFPDA